MSHADEVIVPRSSWLALGRAIGAARLAAIGRATPETPGTIRAGLEEAHQLIVDVSLGQELLKGGKP